MTLSRLLLGAFGCLLALPLWGKDVLTLGVLAFRNEAQTAAQWQPLEGYLHNAIPEYDFKVVAMDLTRLREAVRRTQVDIVITQPAEYVRMAHQNGLASPLATLLGAHEGRTVRVFGGSILTRADRKDIQTLADLEGKRVAAPAKDSFAGYQLQIYTLQKERIAIGPVLETGSAHDSAIEALMQGKVDVAFVRTGLWESMQKEGRVAPGQLKAINAQQLSGYPFEVSTGLYPEWPVIALPHVRDEMSARLAGALLSLPHRSEVSRQIGIAGFAVPSDYDSVRTVMRAVRAPPFDTEAQIRIGDVWEQYYLQIMAVMLAAFAIGILAVRSTLLSRRLRDLNDNLEFRITQRTSELADRNVDLAHTLEALEQTRDELVDAAKLAALGSLVAGISHELNTPIGNGLTVASTLEERSLQFKKELDLGIKRSALDAFVADTQLASDILVRSLTRAATLVTSFKQVAADQTSSQRRQFLLKETLEEVLLTLSPTLKRSGCRVHLVCAEGDVKMDSYPGPLGQAIANLVNNSLFHAYGETVQGEIRIHVSAPENGFVSIDVEDDGVGISASHLARIFEPFFTTRLGKGGSGLGLSITRNIVVGVLGGKIQVNSTEQVGTAFSLWLPLTAPESDT
jgi:signal transduction histidine kinase